MRLVLTSIALIASLASTSPSLAQQQAELTCKDLLIPIRGASDSWGVSIPITAEQLVQQCKSTTGAKITLTSPVGGLTAKPSHDTTTTYAFTVVDDKGNTATASVIVTRD